ncbi:MAG: flippase-like domain-containing protein [Thermomicrobiales bacterium]|nr:flippase-like domain-containing protein [Thermomicrobiales bacterium]
MLKRFLAIPTPVVFLVSVGIAILLLWQQGAMGEIGPALRSANPWQIVAGLLLYLAGLILLCVRWSVLVRMIGGKPDSLLASEAFVTSVAMNYAAPLSLAIPGRALLTMRALGLSKSETAGLSFWEVAADLLVLAAGTGLWILLGGWRGEGLGDIDSTWAIGGLLLALIALVAIVAAIRSIKRLRTLAASLLGKIGPSLRHPMRRPGPAALALALTILFWIIQGVVIGILLTAIDGVRPAGLLVLGLTTFPILIGMISPVPGGAGIREALMIAVAGVHSANEASVLLAGVTYRIALFAALPVLYLAIRLLIEMRPGGRGTIGGEAAPSLLTTPGGERDLD